MTRTWATGDGLPQNSVVDIAASPDGFIYVATYGGLGKFDGERFQSEDLAQSPIWETSRLRSLEFDAAGRLFVVTIEGDLFVKQFGGWKRIHVGGIDTGDFRVDQIVPAPNGSVLLVSPEDVYEVPAGSLGAERILSGNFADAVMSDEGELYLIFKEGGGVCKFKDGKLEIIESRTSGAVWMGREGSLYSRTNGDLYHIRGGEKRRLDLNGEQPKEVVLARDGGLYVLTLKHVYYQPKDESELELLDLQMSVGWEDNLVALLEDKLGNLWVGSDATGLIQATTSPLSVFRPPSRPHAPYIDRISLDGSGHALLRGWGIWSLAGGQMDFAYAEGTHNFSVRSAGGYWMVGADGLGTWEDGERQLVNALPDYTNRDTLVLEGRDGTVWIATADHLLSWDGVHIESRDLPDDGVRPEMLFEDAEGRIWLSRFSTVLVWDGAGFEEFHAGGRFPFGTCRTFFESPKGTLWCGTYGAGVFRIKDGEVVSINTSQGLYENTALTFIPDGDFIVIMGNNAVSRYLFADLEAVASGELESLRGRSFNTGPGITMFEGNGHSPLLPDSDGLIWLSTLHGVGQFDAEKIRPANDGLLASVEASSATKPSPLAGRPGATLFELPPDLREISFAYNAASFLLPRQLTFRYRLLGLEDDWHVSHDSDQITYGKLPPGQYVFEIQAAEADGAFGPINSSVHVHVPPTFVEQVWFKYLVGLGIMLTAAGLFSVRLRIIARRARLLELMVEGRTEELRLAGDHLEHKVDLRTQELANALGELEQDMKRREQLEGRLIESEKLEAVGRLAGGLAHDFNNILTAILGEADLARLGLESHVLTSEQLLRQKEHLRNVSDAGARAAELTHQLLAYSRQQVLQPRVVNPVEVVGELLVMLRRLVADNVEIKTNMSTAGESILIDPGQLEQVIVNLVVNASESMPEGGVIEIGMSIANKVCVLEVGDSGSGLTEQEQARIFEPFFSSKGKGRGLGLASVQGIVVQSGGDLSVQSEPGAGSTFRIELPLTEAVSPVPTAPMPVMNMTGVTALLVDDEAAVLAVTKQMLAMTGMTVLAANSPEVALEFAEQNLDQIDLLVTDVVMPDRNGKELSRCITELRPGLPVLFISGYSREVLTDKDLLEPGANLLAKPFDFKALATRVAELVATPD